MTPIKIGGAPHLPFQPPKKMKEKQKVIQKVLDKNLTTTGSLSRPMLTKKNIQPGLWSRFTGFFSSLFSSTKKQSSQKVSDLVPLTLPQEKEAQEIKEFFQGALKVLNSFKVLIQEDEKVQAGLKGKPPSEKTVEASAQFFEQLYGKKYVESNDPKDLAGLAIEIEKIQVQLEEMQERVDDLVKECPALSHFSEQMKKIANGFNFIQSREDFSSDLLSLEASAADYNSIPSWENFNNIFASLDSFQDSISLLIDKNNEESFLRDEPLTAKYVKIVESGKKFKMSEIYQFIKTFFPGLKNQTERLLNSFSNFIKKRVELLNKQIDSIIPLFEKQDELIKRIDSHYQITDGQSIGSKFSRGFYTFIFGNNYFKDQIKKLRQEQIDVYNKIKANSMFNEEELKWIAKSDPKLHQYLEAVQSLTYHSQAAHLIHELTHQVENLKVPVVTDDVKALVTQLFENVEGNVKLLKNLPVNFSSNTPVEQLKILVHSTYRKLRGQTKKLFQLIEEKKMNVDLNDIIKNLPKKDLPVEDEIELVEEEFDLEEIPHISGGEDTKKLTFEQQMDQAIKNKKLVKGAIPSVITSGQVVLDLRDEEEEIELLEKKFIALVEKLPESTAFEKEKKKILLGEKPSFINNPLLTTEEFDCLKKIVRLFAEFNTGEFLLDMYPIVSQSTTVDPNFDPNVFLPPTSPPVFSDITTSIPKVSKNLQDPGKINYRKAENSFLDQIKKGKQLKASESYATDLKGVIEKVNKGELLLQDTFEEVGKLLDGAKWGQEISRAFSRYVDLLLDQINKETISSDMKDFKEEQKLGYQKILKIFSIEQKERYDEAVLSVYRRKISNFFQEPSSDDGDNSTDWDP